MVNGKRREYAEFFSLRYVCALDYDEGAGVGTGAAVFVIRRGPTLSPVSLL